MSSPLGSVVLVAAGTSSASNSIGSPLVSSSPRSANISSCWSTSIPSPCSRSLPTMNSSSSMSTINTSTVLIGSTGPTAVWISRCSLAFLSATTQLEPKVWFRTGVSSPSASTLGSFFMSKRQITV
ncbi:hypothetical protein PI124_g4537 [Phytophthora idaei]|nr:hypothetical protein PI125_g3189 [Phytophthora idaei]KAG3167593.1 hypothetical protein PI126_g3715 [Phytophthora idaei]KAG3250789.1 hypothetical protein PI124_g4537 [Phytophthora idaei]